VAPNRRDCDAVGHQPAAEGAREVGEGPPALVIVVGRTGREFRGTQRGCRGLVVEPVEGILNEFKRGRYSAVTILSEVLRNII